MPKLETVTPIRRNMLPFRMLGKDNLSTIGGNIIGRLPNVGNPLTHLDCRQENIGMRITIDGEHDARIVYQDPGVSVEFHPSTRERLEKSIKVPDGIPVTISEQPERPPRLSDVELKMLIETAESIDDPMRKPDGIPYVLRRSPILQAYRRPVSLMTPTSVAVCAVHDARPMSPLRPRQQVKAQNRSGVRAQNVRIV